MTPEEIEQRIAAMAGRRRGREGGDPALAPAPAEPRAVKPDRRDNGIMPAPFAIVRDLRSEQGELFADLPLGASAQADLFAMLPGEAPYAEAIVPSLPLMLFDSARPHEPGRARGAPLAMRVWVEAMLSVPRAEREAVVRLRAPLGDFVRGLWPHRTYRTGRDGPRLVRALHIVHNARIPYGDGYWVSVAVRSMPVLGRSSSSVVLDVSLPPGSDRGPLVHRPTVRRYGVVSAAAFRLVLALSWLWNDRLTSRGERMPVRRGRRRNPELAERLPMLDPVDLIAMGASEAKTRTPGARRSALHDVRRAIAQMERAGDVVVVHEGEAVRLEPPDWWGQSLKGGGRG